jgi:hypothetical protein
MYTNTHIDTSDTQNSLKYHIEDQYYFEIDPLLSLSVDMFIINQEF